MMPPEGERGLEDLGVELVAKASALAGRVNPTLQRSIGTLVRSMNCYYSNLIEGHDTHPRDIDRALAKDYAKEPRRRALQLEAAAHMEVQRRIDEGQDEKADPTSTKYILWLHREFCARLPEELLWVEDPDTHRRILVRPGAMRDGQVAVGRHVPPLAAALPDFLARFEQAYGSGHLSRLGQIIAVAAAHHRLVWIHPFYDGNGRVARLMSHAMLLRFGIGGSLWSASRGLARNVNRYRELLMAADQPRRSDLDGRGNLSEAALTEFCKFFLQVCVDQVDFMESLLEPSELLRRMQLFIEDETRAGRLPKGAFPVLRETVLAGEVGRGHARGLTGYQERMGRMIVSRLLDRGFLVSDGPRDPVRLGFPIDVVERWFPRLYPAVG
ncbi:MAG: Fic family protein [Acidobacteria bacterium]|nr:Fic family protein [Acidobacteriota bacterium]